MIRTVLKATGLYARGRRNADRVRLRENPLVFADLPPAFDGFRILHLSDLHVEMSAPAMERAAALAASTSYDIAVLTGDYRAATYGAYDTTLEGLARLRPHLKGPVYGVLGNHDSIRMVPGMEAMGIRMLLNESETIRRGDQAIHLAGIDDAGFYGVDNIQKAGEEIPHGGFAILLSHTPEVYRQAAHAEFHLMLSGHTHGGQICLPGGIPLTLDATVPRRYGAGAGRIRGWRAIPPPARAPPSSPCGSIARRRSRCTTCGEVSGAKEPRSNPRPQRQPHPAAADQPAPSSGHGRTARYAP